jgi:hypothetical protein
MIRGQYAMIHHDMTETSKPRTPSTPVIDTCSTKVKAEGLRARQLTQCYIVLAILVYFFCRKIPKTK